MVTCVENNLIDLHEKVRLTANDILGWGAGGGAIPPQIEENLLKKASKVVNMIFCKFF